MVRSSLVKPEALEWLRFASDDLEAAEILLSATRKKKEIICYHCQQAAEKAVKSLYAMSNKEIPRTHDFGVLALGLMPRFDLSQYRPQFQTLQPFAVAIRYPYEMELVEGDEVQAFLAATAVLTGCQKLVPDDVA